MLSQAETIGFGFLLSLLRVSLHASPYLLIGFLTAGALRTLAGSDRWRALFEGGRWPAPLKAWLAAMLLPVCSLGVLPILRELRRAGVTTPAILTFAIAAPTLNPLSLSYGASYLGPRVLAILMLGTFVVSAGAGIALGYFSPEDRGRGEAAADGEESAAPAPGSSRIAAAVANAAAAASGPALGDIAAGILGAGFVAAIVSPSFLSSATFAGDRMAIPAMALAAPLSYLTPEQGMVIVPEMIKFRQSAGAMVVLMILGVGMSLGHVTWIRREYGRRIAGTWLLLVAIPTLGFAAIADRLLPPVGTANEDNDHFDLLSNPFSGHHGPSDLARAARRIVSRAGAANVAAAGLLILLSGVGFAMRNPPLRERLKSIGGPSRTGRVEDAPALWNRPLPAWLAPATMLAGVPAIVAAGFLAYFPSPADAFRDMAIIKADFYGELGSPSPDASLYHLDLWDRQAGRLEVGAWIRLTSPGPEASRRVRELKEGLGSLRSDLEQGRSDLARRRFPEIQDRLERCRIAFQVR
ncbi:permease [Aquisphaera insulae]|uniref:permease n=1 Tax=Aquisphaera insulae TaxID=2712864 RepID=UPI0013EA9209|nr:permease [Aquisphaera insulae]